MAEQSKLAGRIHWVPSSNDRGRAAQAKRRRQTITIVLAAVVSAAAVAGVLVLTVGGSHSSSPPPTTAPSTPAPALSAANVIQRDVPTGWNVDSARTLSSQNSASWRQVFASCMGLPASQDPVGQPPAVVATQQSPDFMGSPQPNLTELGSTAVQYSSSAPVRAQVAELANPKFAGCLGRAYAQTVGGGGAASAGVVHLALEQVPGVIGTGYQVTISAAGSQDTIDIDYVVVSGGRIRSLMVGMSVGKSFPSLVTAAAAYALERRLAVASPS
jgi:hypothetical protein